MSTQQPRRRQSALRALQRIRVGRKRVRELSNAELLRAHDLVERLLNQDELEPLELRELQKLLGPD